MITKPPTQPTKEVVRWGILSTARINRALIGPLEASPRSELVAVASRTLSGALKYANANSIPRACGSYEELLADPEIDAVYISLPNHLHCEWTVAAAESGKHVLCEKPLVLTLAELYRIDAAAQAHQVTVFEAFMYLHHPQTLRLLEMRRSGELGRLESIRSHFSFELTASPSDNIRLQPQMGGGSLWDIGVYPVSFSVVMADAGLPAEVSGVQRTGETGVDIDFEGEMRFANGVTAHVSCSFRQPLAMGATLIGSEQTVTVDEPWKPGAEGKDSVIHTRSQDGEEASLVFPASDPYLCEVSAMEACILDSAEPLVPLALSKRILRTVLALYESAESGRPVTLSPD